MQSRLPEGLVVRALRPGDAEAFHALQHGPSIVRGNADAPYSSVGETREWIAGVLSPALAIGAWVGETMVGEAELHPQKLRRAHVGQIGISVHDGWQRRGIGAHLMRQILDFADNWLGLRRLELHVFTDNAPAIALYRQSGFEVEARFRGTVLREGVLIDAFLMARLREALPFAQECSPCTT
ncbi:GNAT family N-acetyltransferase [Paraburkholderia pallida]|uniref:GNAT family N-acetyltransferase n=1 Tax=Paraburkholderia pallida TaxID=2547399 RepID=A0A4P7D057_9BURK|nr:GNAT family N-acetyltransferase [Paraburkholderia pallida]QBR00060.1 GNAT family N-acetyltransferase [Paraburkholderia pallida]